MNDAILTMKKAPASDSEIKASADIVPSPKRQRVRNSSNEGTSCVLGDDVVSHILGFLGTGGMLSAVVCNQWRNAAKNSLVPVEGKVLVTSTNAELLSQLPRILPRVQSLFLGGCVCAQPGNEPILAESHDEEDRTLRNMIDIMAIAKLQELIIRSCVDLLNGSCPCLQHSNFQAFKF